MRRRLCWLCIDNFKRCFLTAVKTLLRIKVKMVDILKV